MCVCKAKIWCTNYSKILPYDKEEYSILNEVLQSLMGLSIFGVNLSVWKVSGCDSVPIEAHTSHFWHVCMP